MVNPGLTDSCDLIYTFISIHPFGMEYMILALGFAELFRHLHVIFEELWEFLKISKKWLHRLHFPLVLGGNTKWVILRSKLYLSWLGNHT